MNKVKFKHSFTEVTFKNKDWFRPSFTNVKFRNKFRHRHRGCFKEYLVAPVPISAAFDTSKHVLGLNSCIQ